MLFSELQRVQNRFSYLLEPLPSSFENLLRQIGFPLDWDNYPLFDLDNDNDLKRLDDLSNFFWKIETNWRELAESAKDAALQVRHPFIIKFLSLTSFLGLKRSDKAQKAVWHGGQKVLRMQCPQYTGGAYNDRPIQRKRNY